MDLEHEHIDELLAGYTLLSLSGPDAAETDRLLAEHVPGCVRCRQTLADFQMVAGDLALEADPADPPELLLPRIHRAMDDVPTSRGTSRRGAFVAMAASIVALVAMGGLSFALVGQASQAKDQTETALEVLSVMRSPGAEPVSVDAQGGTPSGTGFVEVSSPLEPVLYLAADDVPEPAPGYDYQLWLGRAGIFVPVGEMFRPDDGIVLIAIGVAELERFDEIWITEERAGEVPSEPRTDGGRSWRATLSTTTP